MPNTKYEADDGDIKPIRLALATISAAGAPPSGAIDDPDFVKVSKSNREFGMRPRGVRLSRNLGSDEEPNLRYKFLPVLTPTAFGSAGFQVGAEITVGGNQWEVIGRIPEDV